MMRHLIVSTLAFAAISAQADTRVVNESRFDKYSRATACNDAKRALSRHVGRRERLVSIGQCDCDQNKFETWTCTVNGRVAEYEEKSKSDDDSGSQGGSYPQWSGSGGMIRVQPAPAAVLGGVE